MTAEASLFIRLYLDEDVHKRVATALRLRGFGVVRSHALQHWGLTDDAQLALASASGRTLFTFNTADYIRLHFGWMQGGRMHAGIVVSDQLPLGETIHRLLNLLNRVMADQMNNEIRWLQSFK